MGNERKRIKRLSQARDVGVPGVLMLWLATTGDGVLAVLVAF